MSNNETVTNEPREALTKASGFKDEIVIAKLKDAPSIETEDNPEDDAFEPGEFPVDALNPVMRQIVEETAHTHQLAPQLPAMAAIATVAAAAGKAWTSTGASNAPQTPCNLMITIAVPKSYGKGLSSTIVKPLTDASDEMEERFYKEERPILEGEKMDLEAQIKILTDVLNPRERKTDNEKNNAKPPLTEAEKTDIRKRRAEYKRLLAEIDRLLKNVPTYWLGGTSMAGMVEALTRNNHAIYHFSPEAGEPVRIALGKHTKDQQSDLDLLLSGYSVESYRNTTVSRGDHRLVPCITSCWMVQPFLLRELLGNQEALERGLTARMLTFVYEPENIAEDDGKDRYVKREDSLAWDTLICGIINERKETKTPHVIEWNPEAREEFLRFHNESVRLRNGDYREIQGELGRWRENAIRIGNGIVIADALTGRGSISFGTREQALRAIKIMRWCGYSQLALLRDGMLQRLNVRIDKLWLCVQGEGGHMTLRCLRQNHGFGEKEVMLLVAKAPHRLIIQEVQNPNGGPRSRIVTCLRNV